MGGFGREVRAQTREEAWLKFESEVRPEIEDRFGLFLEAPLSREAAIENMWREPQDRAWVLDYYFTK
jgi:hypothetical protein